MDPFKCQLDIPDARDCWINELLSGKTFDEELPPPDQVSRCVTCETFLDALERSTGRRRSDRLVTEAIMRLLSVMSSYNTELTGMAATLHSRIEELTVLKTVADALLKATNLNESLRIFLTGITAGEAFGFNRAAVFLVNQPRRTLEGQIGFGHLDPSSYGMTWQQIATEQLTFSDMIQRILNGEEFKINELKV